MFGEIIKILTNKKVLIILAVFAVFCGSYLFIQSQNAIHIQSDIDMEEVETEKNMRANIEVEEETKELSQSPQPMPTPEEVISII